MTKPLLPRTDVGKGPATVWIHGFLENRQMWTNLLDEFSRKCRCITVDLPGHGQNKLIATKESMQSMARKVVELLDHLNISEFVCVGHSMGGYVGCAITEMVPQRITRLIMLASHADSDSSEKKINRTRAEKLIEHKYDNFVREAIPGLFDQKNLNMHQTHVDAYIADALSHSPEAMKICSVAMKERASFVRSLDNSDCAVDFISGKNDPIVAFKTIRSQASKIRHSRVFGIDHCGHMPHIEQPHALINHLNRALEF